MFQHSSSDDFSLTPSFIAFSSFPEVLPGSWHSLASFPLLVSMLPWELWAVWPLLSCTCLSAPSQTQPRCPLWLHHDDTPETSSFHHPGFQSPMPSWHLMAHYLRPIFEGNWNCTKQPEYLTFQGIKELVKRSFRQGMKIIFLKEFAPLPTHLSLGFKISVLVCCRRRCCLGNLRVRSHNGNEKVKKKHSSNNIPSCPGILFMIISQKWSLIVSSKEDASSFLCLSLHRGLWIGSSYQYHLLISS